VTYFAARLARRLARSLLGDLRTDVQLVLLMGRLVYIAVVVIGFLAFIWVVATPALAPVLGAVGLLGLAFGLAFQDVLKNFLSGVFLLLERPFKIGDEITVGDYSGKVETILLRVTVLRTTDGLMVMLPNQQVYTSAIVNSTGYQVRQYTSTVRLVGGGSPVDLAEAVRDQLKQIEGVATEPPPMVAVVPNIEFGPTLEAKYWIDYREHLPAEVQRQVNGMLVQVAGIQNP
jgi:small-conductance mechanosensitive channel